VLDVPHESPKTESIQGHHELLGVLTLLILSQGMAFSPENGWQCAALDMGLERWEPGVARGRSCFSVPGWNLLERRYTPVIRRQGAS
jgi:hypothetical protein